MNKSLKIKRKFSASNKGMLKAIRMLSESDNSSLLKDIDIVMPLGAYVELVEKGFYQLNTEIVEERIE